MTYGHYTESMRSLEQDAGWNTATFVCPVRSPPQDEENTRETLNPRTSRSILRGERTNNDQNGGKE